MTDRLTKQDLKEDTLVKETARAADFMAHHGRAIVGGVVVLLVVVAGVFFVRSNQTRTSEQAAEILAQAQIAFQNGNFDGAAQSLETLVSRHGGTESGSRGRLLFGDVRYAQGRFDEALAQYQAAAKDLGGKGFVTDAARRGVAACFENLDRFQEAAAEYHALAETAPNDVIRSELRLSEARNLVAAGQADAAKTLLEDVGKNPDNPRAAQYANLMLAELKYR